MNKNTIIAALAVLAIIGSIWGSIMGSQRSGLKEQLVEKDRLISEFQEKQSFLTAQADKGKKLESTLSGQTTKYKAVRDELSKQKAKSNKKITDLQAALQSAQKELVVRQEALESVQRDVSAAQKVSVVVTADNKNMLETAQNKIIESQKILLATQDDLQTVTQERDRSHSNLAARDEKVNQLRVELKQAKRLIDEQTSQGQELGQSQEKLLRELKKSQEKAADLELRFDATSQELEESQKQFDQLLVNKDVLLSKISEQNTSLEHYAKELRDLKKKLKTFNGQN
jgi:chromosome segregation ATPase